MTGVRVCGSAGGAGRGDARCTAADRLICEGTGEAGPAGPDRARRSGRGGQRGDRAPSGSGREHGPQMVRTVRRTRAGLEGLKDAVRSGRPRRYDDLVRVAVVAAATGIPPGPTATR